MTEDMIKATMIKMISDQIEKNDWTVEQKMEAQDLAREFIEKYGSRSMFHRGELDKKLKLLKEKYKQ